MPPWRTWQAASISGREGSGPPDAIRTRRAVLPSVNVHPFTRRIIDATPPRFRPGAVLVLRTADDSINDRVPGLAAEIAFFLLLSLVPLLLTILGTIGLLADLMGANVAGDVVDSLAELAGNVFSASTIDGTIRPLLSQLVEQGRGDVVTIGFVVTIFSASRALRVVATAITIAYDLEQTRAGWQQRAIGLGLTLGGVVVAVAIVPLLVLGPGGGQVVADNLPVDAGLPQIWAALYWPVAGLVATALVTTLYHLVAPWWTPWRRDLPGAALAVVLFLLGTVALRTYTATSFGEGSVYGQFVVPLAAMLWLWISAIALLVGAELNAEVERLWPTTTERREHEIEAGHLEPDAPPVG